MQHTFTCKLTELEQIGGEFEAQNDNGYIKPSQNFIIEGTGRKSDRYNIGVQIAVYCNSRHQITETKNYQTSGNETIKDRICFAALLSNVNKYTFNIVFFDYELLNT